MTAATLKVLLAVITMENVYVDLITEEIVVKTKSSFLMKVLIIGLS